MQTIKTISAIGCFILALYFWLLKLDGMSVWFAVCGVGFIEVGCVLFAKRESRTSRNGKAVVVMTLGFVGAFMVLIGIPDIVAARYESSQNACVNNLRQLQAAKNEWALENGITNGTLVTANDITPYIQLDSNGHLPKCPAGGTYILGRVGEDVRCSIGNADWPNSHVLAGTEDYDWWTNFKYAYATLFGFRQVKTP